jgi:hypothetical protein
MNRGRKWHFIKQKNYDYTKQTESNDWQKHELVPY